MESIATYRNYVIVSLDTVTQIYELLHLPKYKIHLPLQASTQDKKQQIFMKKLEQKKQFPTASINNLSINVNATNIDRIIAEKSVTAVGSWVQQYVVLNYKAHILKPKLSTAKKLKFSVLLMKQHLLPLTNKWETIISYIQSLPQQRLAIPKLKESYFYLDKAKLQIKSPTKHVLRIHLQSYYSANIHLFTDGSIAYFDKLLGFLLHQQQREEVHSEIAVTKMQNFELPYVFSSKQAKYGLQRGNSLVVMGSNYSLQQWLPHALHRYKQRVLWIGSQPLHPSLQNVHTIPMDERKLDLPMMSKSASRMQDTTIIGKLLEELTRVPMFVEEFRHNVFNNEEYNLYSKINRQPITEVIRKISENESVHPTENQNVRQLELVFSQFSSSELKFLDNPIVKSEYIHPDFDFRVHHIDALDVRILAIKALTIITWAQQHEVPYDLVVITCAELTNQLLRKRLNSDPLLTLLQIVNGNTAFILYTNKQLQTDLPKLYLEGKNDDFCPLYDDSYNPALQVLINNTPKSSPTEFQQVENTPDENLRPKESVDTEQIWFTTASSFVHHIFNRFFLQQGTDTRIITSSKILVMIAEGIKRWELLDALQQGAQDNSPESQFSETEYRETRRWLKRNELINVVRTGLTGLTDKFSLTEKGEVYHLTIINKARALFDDFHSSVSELESEILLINDRILDIVQENREYTPYIFNLIYVNIMFIVYREYKFTNSFPAKILGFIESWDENYRIAEADSFLQQLQVEGYDAHIQRVEDTSIERLGEELGYKPQRVFHSIKSFISNR